MRELREKGLERLDFPVRNKEGGFLVKDREETTYLLREWHEGRECDVRELSEVEEAVRALGFSSPEFPDNSGKRDGKVPGRIAGDRTSEEKCRASAGAEIHTFPQEKDRV